ncbi:MAG: hypothetical protein KDA99_20295, partial [Planctomycetales bacterium]|nr:hypothetical protein [Planctomycetales bacterium]
QQQQQQGNQNAARAEQVADLQKQVITATWNLIRREKGDEPSATFDADTQLIAESQAAVRQQADELASQLSDPQSIEYAEEVYRHIDRAVEELTKAHDERDISALRPALAAEQSAYQSMLRLRAREHEVVRANQQQQQQQSSQNSSSNRMQQQLQQLELREDRNRYETQNLAQPQEETAEQREDRQVLNRLRELARRQDDLNERVKELQSALEAAQTPDEREEIERQLKRLREEQQQILRDADELRDRMEQPQNQERMSEQREQMEQARENARQASEALEQGQVSRAAAEGSRAQDQFEELRDEFQNRTSDQFTEQMRQMREQVQEVERRQRDIAQQMEDGQPVGDEPPSLRSENPNEDLGERLNDQRLRVDELVQQIRDTVEEAEQIEPLLAEELYDTYRDAEMNNPQQNLNRARVMWQAGLRENARQEEQVAREQIERLREGIERAAESVLGDETDALRRAEQQLRQLTEDVQNEVARETNVANQRRADSDNNAAQGQEGEPQQGATRESNQQRQQQDGRQPDGPQQDGQQQDGQQRGGQRQTTRPQDGQSQDRQQGGGRDEQQEGQQQEGQQQEGQQQEGQQQEGQQGGQQQGRQQQGGQQQGGQQQGDRQQGGEPQGGQQQQAGQQRGGSRVNDGGLRRGGGDIDFLGGAWDDWDQVIRGPIERVVSPISGDDFVEWSDRLREVEEMISVPELRAEATRIREQARTIRRDVRRHSEAPNWELVDMSVIKPLHELQQRISEEVLRRQGGDAIVPIDRDPVPLRFERAVREYYEQLGTGQ